jgi:DNA-binding transcriptional LysR family regulator
VPFGSLRLPQWPCGEPQLEFRHLFTDELQFILSPLHPWAQAGNVEEAQIPRQSYILYEKTSYTFQMIHDYFRNRNQVLFMFMELGNMEAIKELVKLNLGLSILASWIAKKELGEKSLVALRSDEKTSEEVGNSPLERSPPESGGGNLRRSL